MHTFFSAVRDSVLLLLPDRGWEGIREGTRDEKPPGPDTGQRNPAA